MKSILVFLLLAFSLNLTSQNIDKIIEDGLVLSYYLANDDFDKIEMYISENNFKYSSKENQVLWYDKTIDKEEIISLIIKTNADNPLIGFTHDDEANGSFFIQKTRKRIKDYCDKNFLFHCSSESKVKESETENWWFIYPKPLEQKEYEIKKGTQVKGYENVDYVCLIRIFDDLIGFSVAHHNELILWDKYIPNLLKEIK